MTRKSTAKFAEMLTESEVAIGGGALFSQTCRSLIRNSPANPDEFVTIPVITLQNILRGAFRQIDGGK